jgi:hypothetical protein
MLYIIIQTLCAYTTFNLVLLLVTMSHWNPTKSTKSVWTKLDSVLRVLRFFFLFMVICESVDPITYSFRSR